MGCSIGGRIVLYLAHQHGGRFRAMIGLESSAHVAPYYDVTWLHRPDVHGGEVSAGVVSGLIAPTAPDEERWETLWHYMQSGPGVFKGDLYFYKVDGDIRDRVDQIDGRRPPLYLLTGEYDYSCTSEGTLDVARRTGAEATIMPGLGHFPMSEDPDDSSHISCRCSNASEEQCRVEPEDTPCRKPKPFAPCNPPPAQPTPSSRSRARCASTRSRTRCGTTRGATCSTPSGS